VRGPTLRQLFDAMMRLPHWPWSQGHNVQDQGQGRRGVPRGQGHVLEDLSLVQYRSSLFHF